MKLFLVTASIDGETVHEKVKATCIQNALSKCKFKSLFVIGINYMQDLL